MAEQLAAGIANFYEWKCNQGGFFDGANACQHAANFRLTWMKSAKVHKVEREPALNALHGYGCRTNGAA